MNDASHQPLLAKSSKAFAALGPSPAVSKDFNDDSYDSKLEEAKESPTRRKVPSTVLNPQSSDSSEPFVSSPKGMTKLVVSNDRNENRL